MVKKKHQLPVEKLDDPQWHSRGYLPHFDDQSTAQFVTFRLFDSLPSEVIAQIEWEHRLATDGAKKQSFHKLLENSMDQGLGECWLARPEIATIVQDALLFFDGDRYRIDSWVIMPNHVHVLIEPLNFCTLSDITFSWKSFTSKKANKLLGRFGRFWCPESFDRYIRDARHFYDVQHYIEDNPVKAGLCARAEDWEWSSAFHRVRGAV